MSDNGWYDYIMINAEKQGEEVACTAEKRVISLAADMDVCYNNHNDLSQANDKE